MESIYAELAFYGSARKCAKTDTVFLPISEDCDGTVSLENALYLHYMHYMTLYYTIVYNIVQYYTIIHFTLPYYKTLHYTVL